MNTGKFRRTQLMDRILAGVAFMALLAGALYLTYLLLSLFFWSLPVFASLFVIGAGLIALMADEILVDWDRPRISIRSYPTEDPDDE